LNSGDDSFFADQPRPYVIRQVVDEVNGSHAGKETVIGDLEAVHPDAGKA